MGVSLSTDQNPANIDCVIVNWNAGDQLACAVEAALSDKSVARVIIVDNASDDGSLSTLPSCDRVLVLHNDRNLGFGKACNIGAELGRSPYILFLNPDTRVEENSAKQAASFLTESAEYVACGIRLYGDSNTTQRHCARFPNVITLLGEALGISKILPGLISPIIMTDFDHEQSRDVDHVIGAFYMVRRAQFEAVRGFDEDFFVYFEDLDLSRRLTFAGEKIRYLSDVQSYHRGGGTSDAIRAKRLFFSMNGRLLYSKKHLPPWQYAIVKFAMRFIEPQIRIAGAQLTLREQYLREEVRAGIRLYVENNHQEKA
jgi:N-acetylglucosaminyl-diphospho-decaprenol L-rhamnosyltransferase